MALSTEPARVPTHAVDAKPTLNGKRRSWFKREKRRRQEDVQMKALTSTPGVVGKHYLDKAPERGTPIKVSHDELFKIACNYEEYSCPSLAPNITVREGLQNLDDVTPYGVTQGQQKDLWKEEIGRLSSAVTNLETPISFTGTAELSHDTKDAYEILANLGDQMWTALNIVIHDSESILSRHCPKLSNEGKLKQSRQVLERLTGDDEEEEGSQDTPLGKEGLKGTLEDYFELVNYVTAILARIFCKAAYGQTWHDNILACLAKLSTKLKVLSAQREEFASISLSMAPARKALQVRRANYARKPGDVGMNRGGPLESLDEMLQSLNSPKSTEGTYSGPDTRRKVVERTYWAQCLKFRFPIHMILCHFLMSLRGQNRLTTTSNTSYELCAMLYHTGFEHFPNLVFQDKNGEYLGSSKPENVNVAHAVFEVLNLTVKELETIRQKKKVPEGQHQSDTPVSSESTQPTAPTLLALTTASSETPTTKCSSERLTTDTLPSPHEQVDVSGEMNVPEAVGTTISWNYTAIDSSSESQPKAPVTPNQTAYSDPSSKKLLLGSMSEVIMVMVPLLLANPKVVDMTTDFIGLCVHTMEVGSDTTQDKILLYRQAKFKAFFCLSTNEYRSFWMNRPHWPVSQLSKAPMARDKLLSRKAGEDIPVGTQTWELPLTNFSQEEKESIERAHQELEGARRKMNEWIFEETGVRVKCRLYVWTALAITITLVLGGIVIGVTVRNRLKGVDPFGITTFCWALAAFTILMVKSIHVENWPWRDFLRGQVLCRSVSELHSVTGVDDQLILAKLLHEEPTTILKTRGPYNCVFTHKSDGADGFSIDRPLSMRTMLLSGLIMIQVQATYHGEYLVCLDVRRVNDFSVVLQSKDPTDKREYIVSDKFSTQDSHSAVRQRIPLKKKNITWNHVVGVYGQRDCLFT